MSSDVSSVRCAVRTSLYVLAAWGSALTPALGQTAPPAQSVAPASPATANPNDSPELTEIVVEARRVSENLQQVPVTVSAVTPEALSRNDITNITDLQTIVPTYQGGAKFVGNSLAAGAIRIRGVPSVANYFADVPYSVAFRAPYFDVQNVEVLQGPQGTLFGQASNAGAVVITPNKPGNQFAGFFEVEAGDAERKVISGAMDIPIVKDTVLLRIAAKTGYVQGYLQDIFSGARLGADDYNIGRVILTIRPISNLEIETMFSDEKFYNDGTSPAVLEDFDFSRTSPGLAAQAAVNGMTVAQFNAARDYVLGLQEKIGPYKFQGWSVGCFQTAGSPALKPQVPGPDVAAVVPYSCGTPSLGSQNPQLLTNTIKWDFTDKLTLKSIFGANGNTTQVGLFDTDLTRLIIRDSDTNPLAARVIHQSLWDFANWSSEVQLLGSRLWDDRLSFVSGVFNQRTATAPAVTFANLTTSLNDTATRTYSSTSETAVYAQGDFNITDRLTATVGARETWDGAKQETQILDPTTLAVKAVSGGPGSPFGEGSWKSLSYTVGLRYELDDKTMFYFTHSKGYSAGGLQNVAGAYKYNPDHLYNLEIGAKSTFSLTDAVTVRTDASAYYGFFKDVKVATTADVPIPGTTGSQFLTITQNAGEARVTGLTADIAMQFRKRFQLQLQAAAMHNYYTKYNSIDPLTGLVVNESGTPFVNSPSWKGTVSATYFLPVNEEKIGNLSVGADFSATPMTWANISKPYVPNDPTNPDTGAICRERRTAANGYGPLSADGGWAYKDCAPATHNLNLRLDWRNPLGLAPGLRTSLVVTNATGFVGYSGTGFSYDSLGYTNIYPMPPRYIYLNARYDW